MRPSKIRAAQDEWRNSGRVEFFVDFETVSDLADDMSRLPERGGQPLIFMIGCGHVEDGAWRFGSFVVRDLTEAEEARIINGWLAHMAEVKSRLDPDGHDPTLFHWSPAEVTNFETAYNSAKKRHDGNWPSPKWFDFLREVMWAEPVVVRGALAFGLKAVAKALHRHGLIKTSWGDGQQTDSERWLLLGGANEKQPAEGPDGGAGPDEGGGCVQRSRLPSHG